MRSVARSSLVGLLIIGLNSTAALTASPYGNWKRPSTGGVIKAYKCGGGIGLKVIKSKDRAKVGKTLMCGAKRDASGTFTGSIKNLEDGQTYTGKVVINGNTMSLSGCVFGGMICKTENWRRVK